MSLEEHLGAMLGQVGPLEPLDITLREAIGCQLVGDVAAPNPVPHYARAAISGYAVRSVDLTGPATLKVVDDVQPGFAPTQPVYAGWPSGCRPGRPSSGRGGLRRPRPPAATGAMVELSDVAAPGAGITAVGAVAAEGQEVLRDGAVIDPSAVGLLALLGVVRVGVRPRPRVVVVTIGNDLAPAGSPPTAGLVYDAAGPMLVAAAEEAGAVPYRVGPVAYDDRDIHSSIDDQVIRADLLVVVGRRPRRTASCAPNSTPWGRSRSTRGPLPWAPSVTAPSVRTRTSRSWFFRRPRGCGPALRRPGGPLIHAMRGVRGAPPVQVQVSDPLHRSDLTQLIPARYEGPGVVRPMPDPTLVDLTTADVLLRVLPGSDDQPAGHRACPPAPSLVNLAATLRRDEVTLRPFAPP